MVTSIRVVSQGVTGATLRGPLRISGEFSGSPRTVLITDPDRNEIIIGEAFRKALSTLIDEYNAAKTEAAAVGGSLSSNVGSFNFDLGARGKYYASALMTINSMPPDAYGNFLVLPGKTVDVYPSEQDGVDIEVAHAPHSAPRDLQFIELDRMCWVLYHRLNELCGSMQIYAPSLLRSGDDPRPFLGTFLNYQALVARWNMYAWAKCFMFDVQVNVSRCTVVMGYTSITEGAVDVEYYVVITVEPPGGDEMNLRYVPLTLFDLGTDTDINSGVVTFTRNNNQCTGTGYVYIEESESGSPYAEQMKSGEVAVTGLNMSKVNSRHRTVFGIAPMSGAAGRYNESSSAIHTVTLTPIWKIANDTFSLPSRTITITAVGEDPIGSDSSDSSDGSSSGGSDNGNESGGITPQP